MAVTSAILTTCAVLFTCQVASVWGVPGRLCFTCEKVSNAQDCDNVVQCAEDEVCFSQRFIEGNLQEYYRMGCRAPDVCKQETVDLFGFGSSLPVGKRQEPEVSDAHALSPRQAPTEMALCFQCCDKNYCNPTLCGSAPTNQLRCFDCGSDRVVDHPKDCDKITECAPHHLCFVHYGPIHSNHRLAYDMGCMADIQCRAAERVYNNLGCFKCCGDDYCNFNACDNFTMTSPASSTQMTAPITTATTTTTPLQPEVTLFPGSTVSLQYKTKFSTYCSSQPGNIISWALNGSVQGSSLPPGVQSLSNGSLVFSQVNENNTGVYRCVAVGPTGLVTSKTIDIKIVPVPATVLYIERIPVGHITDGDKFALLCKVIGYPPPNITWSFVDTNGGNTVPSSVRYVEHEHKLEFDHFDHQHNDGVWKCTARNTIGSGEGYQTLP